MKNTEKARKEKLQKAMGNFWRRLGQLFDAYSNEMAPFTILEELEKTIRFKHEDDKYALFEAMQLASIGTNLYEMTGQQRFAFAGASLRKPEALAWYNHLKQRGGIGTLTKQEFEAILRQDRGTTHGNQLLDGCRLKD